MPKTKKTKQVRRKYAYKGKMLTVGQNAYFENMPASVLHQRLRSRNYDLEAALAMSGKRITYFDYDGRKTTRCSFEAELGFARGVFARIANRFPDASNEEIAEAMMRDRASGGGNENAARAIGDELSQCLKESPRANGEAQPPTEDRFPVAVYRLLTNAFPKAFINKHARKTEENAYTIKGVELTWIARTDSMTLTCYLKGKVAGQWNYGTIDAA